jgi:histidinol-phosphate aminotransferase
VEPSELVAYPYPAYVLYETLAEGHGARFSAVPFGRDFALPQALFGCDAKLVFVTTPNSPSGTAYEKSELRRLAESLPRGLLVIDEAYVEFAGDDALSLAAELPNVLVTRTLSKSQSLAGMRVGLLFGSTELVRGIAKIKDSYNLDRLAIAAGAAALRDPEWTRRNVERIVRTRSRLAQALADLGMEVLPSRANFVFARLADAKTAKRAYLHLKERGILVRYFEKPLLDDGLRITVGTDAEIDALLGELSDFSRQKS